MDRVHTTFQECQADLKAFSRSQREVAAGIAKNLPDSLKSIRARLQEEEATVEENELAARENEVRKKEKKRKKERNKSIFCNSPLLAVLPRGRGAPLRC